MLCDPESVKAQLLGPAGQREQLSEGPAATCTVLHKPEFEHGYG